MTEDRRFLKRRARLVEELRDKGIDDERVLEAIGTVPRHLFVEDAFLPRAYNDEALPIGLKQTISQPFTVAYQSMMLAPRTQERILEIGTGSGYQAAVLCEMGARIFTIERLHALYEYTSRHLKRLGYKALCRCGDGTQGWEAVAPFDGIIVTAGARDVPQKLLEQLKLPEDGKPGGRLIIPLGSHASQRMTRIVRTGPDDYDREITDGFRFVPLIGGA